MSYDDILSEILKATQKYHITFADLMSVILLITILTCTYVTIQHVDAASHIIVSYKLI